MRKGTPARMLEFSVKQDCMARLWAQVELKYPVIKIGIGWGKETNVSVKTGNAKQQFL